MGLESTIVLADPEPVILRPGGLPAEALEAALGEPLATWGDAESRPRRGSWPRIMRPGPPFGWRRWRPARVSFWWGSAG